MVERTTSAAKHYISPREEALLDSYGVTTDEFNRVRENDPDLDRENIAEQNNVNDRGSQMVKDDRPAPELKPSGEMAKEADRQAFAEKWHAEQQNAQEEKPDRDQEREYDREFTP